MRPSPAIDIREHQYMAAVLLALVLAGCHARPDPSRDTAPGQVGCDHPDGFDQDCDGSPTEWTETMKIPGGPRTFWRSSVMASTRPATSDHPTLNLRQMAAGRYSSDLPGAQLGWTVACGPDRGGDGSRACSASCSTPTVATWSWRIPASTSRDARTWSASSPRAVGSTRRPPPTGRGRTRDTGPSFCRPGRSHRRWNRRFRTRARGDRCDPRRMGRPD